MSEQDINRDEMPSPEDEAMVDDTLSFEEGVDDTGEGEADPAMDELDQLRAERDELEAKYLRTAADYQNYVRRSANNLETTREQAILDMVRKLVGIMDTFDRALNMDAETTSSSDILAGVGLVRDEFMKALASMGVERIEAQPGDPFDPSRHEAMMRTPSDAYESNHVVEQYQPGYAACGKTIRGAQVSVSA
ncbi:nucleotide exchange factor GrpE [Mucisphaera calidilacus]|uniref:Protein GrpE n=1 Tax=Mucisphaera calidilacus TaxID=2527982 RepID=A0A518BW13_9BACT|nr:nucleotide exchange factor GrpE [Mucisphaera calidilacus]QDU71173.1 heat shock protein GrpE [Mucisphaera calidilacus]